MKRLAFVCETFAPEMGYLENYLPYALAKLGYKVEIFTSNLPPYYFMGDKNPNKNADLLDIGTHYVDGLTVNVLPAQFLLGFPRLQGLKQKLELFNPDIIQSTLCTGWLATDCALYASKHKIPLFTESHLAKSGTESTKTRDRVKNYIKSLNARFVASRTQICFPITKDCLAVARDYLKIPQRILIESHLGVDTETFTNKYDRNSIEKHISLQTGIKYIIYTGKFTKNKRLDVLVDALEKLNNTGNRISLIAIGRGEERKILAASKYVTIIDQLPHKDLAQFYAFAAAGVWPGDETISTLDCLSCGTPIVISSKVKDARHAFRESHISKYGDVVSLSNAIVIAINDKIDYSNDIRESAIRKYSWLKIAKERQVYYEK